MHDLDAESSLSLGDSFHVDENYEEAIDAYAAALSIARPTDTALQLRALSHRSGAFYKLGRYQDAWEDAANALAVLSDQRPEGLRQGEGEICHKRAGLAALKLQRYDQAKTALQQAAQLAVLNHRPDATYQKWIRECETKLVEPTIENDPETVIVEEVTKPTAAPVETFSATPSTRAAKSGISQVKPSLPKYQYYQSDKFMTISVLEPNVASDDLTLKLERQHVTVQLRKDGVDFTVLCGPLYAEIDVSKSKTVFKEEKVLIKLKKVDAFEWHELFGKAGDAPKKPKLSAEENATTDQTKEVPTHKDTKVRPYSSHRDWDAIEKNVIEEEKNEKPEGDEAMNKLFQQIYSNASEDTKRAMIKSYQTSGGTVLSTNWDEVEKKDYEKERTAPDGVEWKDWEGKKLPMKEDK